MTTYTDKKSNFSILFVDDEEKARKYFMLTFQKNYKILTAQSVDEATIILEEKHQEIGVLITDQRMPGKLGVDLLKKVRMDYPAIVRLLTTAYSDLDDAIAAVNSGEILRYISKPWDFNQLAHELDNAMQFFELRNERDLLIGEKLSVLQHMTAVNRVRDLIMFASGLSHCDRSLIAIASLLTQKKIVSTKLFIEAHMEMWANIEYEINNMLSLTEAVKKQTMVDNSLGDIDLVEYCQKFSAKFGEVTFSNIPTIRKLSIATRPDALNKLFELLINGDHNVTKIDLDVPTNQTDGAIINIHTKDSTEKNNTINENLISIFLLSYHIGAKVTINQSSNLILKIHLPKSIEQIVEDDIADNWIDRILAQYE